jgi:hypothetical protein
VVERVGTDLLARERRATTLREISDRARRSLQETGCIERVTLGEQIAHCRRDQRLRHGELGQPALSLVGFQVERTIQVTAELVPQRWIEGRRAHRHRKV